jgi:hypothetical protein
LLREHRIESRSRKHAFMMIRRVLLCFYRAMPTVDEMGNAVYDFGDGRFVGIERRSGVDGETIAGPLRPLSDVVQQSGVWGSSTVVEHIKRRDRGVKEPQEVLEAARQGS